MLTLYERVAEIYLPLALRGRCAHCLRYADVSIIESETPVCRYHFLEALGEFGSEDWQGLLNCEEI